MALPELSTFHWLVGIVVGWACIYAAIWASPLPMDFKRQHADRLLSTLNGLVASGFGVAVCFYTSPVCLVEDFQSSWIRLGPLITAGYLMVDIVSMTMCDVVNRWRPVDISMFIHHFFVAGMVVWGAHTNLFLWDAAALLINELSVLPLNTVQILRFLGLNKTQTYTVAGVSLVLVFFLCRMVAIPCLLLTLYRRNFCVESQGVVCAVGCVCNFGVLYTLNSIWFTKLARGALKTVRGGSTGDKVSKVNAD